MIVEYENGKSSPFKLSPIVVSTNGFMLPNIEEGPMKRRFTAWITLNISNIERGLILDGIKAALNPVIIMRAVFEAK